MADAEEETAALMEPFLAPRLSDLGLDYETYGPYLLPLLLNENDDEEEWDSIMELLQASSETHSDDEEAFTKLRSDLQAEWNDRQSKIQAKRKEQEEQEKIAYKKQLEEMQRRALSKQEDDAAKKALLDRFGYEQDDEDGQAEEGPTAVSNKDAAAQMAKEKQNELKSKATTSKKEEQQKTKNARLDKAKLKEERRKRATKGERKR